MNLNPARIAVIAALVLGGVIVLAKGFPGGSSAEAVPTVSPSVSIVSDGPSDSVPPDQSTPPPGDVEPQEASEIPYQVLNGTSTSDLAKSLQQVLQTAGFIKLGGQPANAPSSTFDVTTVYFVAGADETEAAQNEADANAVVEALTDNGLEPVVEEITKSVKGVADPLATVVVVAGEDYADSLVS